MFAAFAISENENHYKTLGITKHAKNEEVKRAYRKLLMAHHPDLGGDVCLTREINLAYSEICRKRGI